MSQATLWLQKQYVQRTLSVLLAGLVFLATAFAPIGGALQANAATLAPEANAYLISRVDTATDGAVRRAEERTGAESKGLAGSLKETATTVKEKLNLDEPLPEGTKDFLKQIRGEDVKVEEPRPSGKGGQSKKDPSYQHD